MHARRAWFCQAMSCGARPSPATIIVTKRSEAVPGARIKYERLDLGDLESVRDCAKRVVDSGIQYDVWLNNAGVEHVAGHAVCGQIWVAHDAGGAILAPSPRGCARACLHRGTSAEGVLQAAACLAWGAPLHAGCQCLCSLAVMQLPPHTVANAHAF